MPIISILILLIIVGILMYCVNTFIPMSSPYKELVNIVAILFVLLWLLQVFGVLGPLSDLRIR